MHGHIDGIVLNNLWVTIQSLMLQIKWYFSKTVVGPPQSPTIVFPGADITRAGTRTSAGGTASGSGRKALSESLEGVMDIDDDPEPKKKSKRGTPKAKADPKAKAQANRNRETGEQTKELQKDIKACLAYMRLLYQKKLATNKCV